jgi:hypothetical protein
MGDSLIYKSISLKINTEIIILKIPSFFSSTKSSIYFKLFIFRRFGFVELRDVSANAVNALTKHCPNLIDIGFLDCLKVDEVALGNVASVLFLLATGT